MKEIYLAESVPPMTDRLMEGIQGRRSPRRHLRPVAVVLCILLLTAGVGAATAGTVQLIQGTRVTFVDDDGNRVNPNGFHTEVGVNMPLSEQALTNIRPYVTLRGAQETYVATSAAEMEAFLDTPLYLPKSAQDTGKYELVAAGPEGGDPVTLNVRIPVDGGKLDVYLRVVPLNILTKTTPKMSTFTRDNGTMVTVALTKESGHAFYTENGLLYYLRLEGDHLLERLKSALDA